MPTLLEGKKDIKKDDNISRLELYRLIGEGYKAMQDGRVSSIDEVSDRINKRRKNRV